LWISEAVETICKKKERIKAGDIIGENCEHDHLRIHNNMSAWLLRARHVLICRDILSSCTCVCAERVGARRQGQRKKVALKSSSFDYFDMDPKDFIFSLLRCFNRLDFMRDREISKRDLVPCIYYTSN